MAYRERIQRVVDEAVKRNKYILIDLHWSNAGTTWGQYTGQHHMPDDNSLVFWESVAEVYKNHPNVLFGLYNEPHDVDWATWRDGGTVTETVTVIENNKEVRKKVTYHTPGMQALVDAIRAKGANNILVVGGLDWGFDLWGVANGYELKDTPEGNGIMYDTHPYPWKNKDWASLIDAAGEKYPILVGEFGCNPKEDNPEEPDDSQFPNYYERIFQWMEEHQYHYTAWDFHPSAGPSLIKNWTYEPTAHHGSFVKEYMKKTARPAVELFVDKNYEGKSIGLAPGEYSSEDLRELGIEPKTVSSIRMQKNFTYTWKVSLYAEDNFSGEEYLVFSNTPDLGEIDCDNGLVSVKIEKIIPENINRGSIASASTGEELAANLTDGDDYTNWLVDEPGDKWVQTDLGKVYTVNRIVIKHAEDKGIGVVHNTQDFTVSVSPDGVTWETVGAFVGNKDYKTVVDLENAPVRYVKVDITKGSQMVPHTRTCISEIEVYGYRDRRAEKFEEEAKGQTDQGQKGVFPVWWFVAGAAAAILLFATIYSVQHRKK